MKTSSCARDAERLGVHLLLGDDEAAVDPLRDGVVRLHHVDHARLTVLASRRSRWPSTFWNGGALGEEWRGM